MSYVTRYSVVPGFRPATLAHQEWRVGGDLAGQALGEQAGLKLDAALVRRLITKHRMGDRRVQPFFQTREEAPATGGRQPYRPELFNKVFRSEFAVIEQGEDRGIDDKRAELFHHVESKCGPSVLRDVEKADERIQADRVERRRAVIRKDGIALVHRQADVEGSHSEGRPVRISMAEY